jgi:hypothetical protein
MVVSLLAGCSGSENDGEGGAAGTGGGAGESQTVAGGGSTGEPLAGAATAGGGKMTTAGSAGSGSEPSSAGRGGASGGASGGGGTGGQSGAAGTGGTAGGAGGKGGAAGSGTLDPDPCKPPVEDGYVDSCGSVCGKPSAACSCEPKEMGGKKRARIYPDGLDNLCGGVGNEEASDIYAFNLPPQQGVTYFVKLSSPFEFGAHFQNPEGAWGSGCMVLSGEAVETVKVRISQPGWIVTEVTACVGGCPLACP